MQLLQIYDADHNKLRGIRIRKDFHIDSTLSTGDKTLSFSYPSCTMNIKNEFYIRTKEDEFVVKEVQKEKEYTSVKASLNVEDMEGAVFEIFESIEKTIDECLSLILAGTGWKSENHGISKRRTVRGENKSAWELLQQTIETYRCEVKLDTIAKTIHIYEKVGFDKGVYFFDTLNLKKLNVQSTSYDFFTEILPIGKDDLRIPEQVLTNYQYSKKKLRCIWRDERYTTIESLREDAKAKLEELSRPYTAYKADILDLAKANTKYSVLSYQLGDIITLSDKTTAVREKQRIVKLIQYPDEPERNSCEISSLLLTFEQKQKEQKNIVSTVNNITGGGDQISDSSVSKIVDKLESIKIITQNITALSAEIGVIKSSYVLTTELESELAKIDTVIAGEIEAVNARIDSLEAVDLEAVNAHIKNLQTEVGEITTLLSGTVTAGSTQTIVLNTKNATIDTALIKEVIAAQIDVGDLKAGRISTDRFEIGSDDGKTLIQGNTIQIRDENRPRVQIGKDGTGDYSLSVWDRSGNLMWDARGAKAAAIKDQIIIDGMISDSANISGKKLNISSVVSQINAGSTKLKASSIQYDPEGQTLDVAFQELTSQVNGIAVGGRNLLTDSENRIFSAYDTNTLNQEFDVSVPEWSTNKAKRIYGTRNSTIGTLTVFISPTDCLFPESNVEYVGSIYIKNNGDKPIGVGRSTTLKATVNPGESKRVQFRYTPENNRTIMQIHLYVDTVGESFDVTYWRPKWEKGNIATDWTPAPEDVDSAIADVTQTTQTLSTQLSISQGKIESLISESSQTKGELTELSNRYNSTVQTVSGIQTKIGEHQSVLDEHTGQIQSVTDKQAQFTVDLNGISGRVTSNETSIESHTQQISSVNAQLNTVTEKTTANTTEISALKGQIVLKVEQSDIEKAVNGIELGGRNLLTDSENRIFSAYDTNTLNQEFDVSVPEWSTTKAKRIYGTRNSTGTLTALMSYGDCLFPEPNVEYVGSIYIKNNGDKPIGVGRLTALRATVNPGESKRVQFRYTPENNRTIMQIHLYVDTVGESFDVTYWRPKWEKGNIATDWTPAPEDTDVKFEDYLKTADFVSQITLNKDSVISAVSSVYATIDSLGQVSSRVSSAEQKLTATGFSLLFRESISEGNVLDATSFLMDKDGLTVKNGNITVQNEAGTNVMWVDDDSGQLSTDNLRVFGNGSNTITITGSGEKGLRMISNDGGSAFVSMVTGGLWNRITAYRAATTDTHGNIYIEPCNNGTEGVVVFRSTNNDWNKFTGCTLDVQGSISVVRGITAASMDAPVMKQAGNQVLDSSGGIRKFQNQGNENLLIHAVNDLTFGIKFGWLSDKRYKDQITDSSVNALSKIRKIRHRSFEWKTLKSGYQELGLVAQELELIDSSWVYKVTQQDGSKTLQIDDTQLFPYLTKSVQELDQKVSSLESRQTGTENLAIALSLELAQLKEKINLLETRTGK